MSPIYISRNFAGDFKGAQDYNSYCAARDYNRKY